MLRRVPKTVSHAQKSDLSLATCIKYFIVIYSGVACLSKTDFAILGKKIHPHLVKQTIAWRISSHIIIRLEPTTHKSVQWWRRGRLMRVLNAAKSVVSLEVLTGSIKTTTSRVKAFTEQSNAKKTIQRMDDLTPTSMVIA